jgi:hypothetical protein
MTQFISLTTTQREQVDYLFADAIFGTDVNAFDYEIRDDNVIGRSRIDNKRDVIMRKPHTVSVNMCVREIPSAFITLEMSRNAETTIKELARSVVERMIKSQTVEA